MQILVNFAGFRAFLSISWDFVDLAKFRGLATARNTRSPEKTLMNPWNDQLLTIIWSLKYCLQASLDLSQRAWLSLIASRKLEFCQCTRRRCNWTTTVLSALLSTQTCQMFYCFSFKWQLHSCTGILYIQLQLTIKMNFSWNTAN